MPNLVHSPQEVTPILGDSIVDSFGGPGEDFQAHYEHGLQVQHATGPGSTVPHCTEQYRPWLYCTSLYGTVQALALLDLTVRYGTGLGSTVPCCT